MKPNFDVHVIMHAQPTPSLMTTWHINQKERINKMKHTKKKSSTGHSHSEELHWMAYRIGSLQKNE